MNQEKKLHQLSIEYNLPKFLFIIIVSIFSPAIKANNDVLKKAELRVLDIGNSYTNDATSLLPLIAQMSRSDLSTMCIYKCVRGGGSFKNWVDIYNNKDLKTYSISKVVGDLPANVQTGTGEKENGELFRYALTNENWDLIIIHQYSVYAPYYSKWSANNAAGYLDELISVIKKHQPNAKLGFLLIHSYWSGYKNNKENLSSYDRWQLIANSVKSFCEDYDVDIVIPYGTAIQNLRSSSLNNEYDLTRDGTHCGYGLAQYTAACCYYESIIAPRSGISVLGNSARIDVSGKESMYPSVNVTDANASLAQISACLAVKDMYHSQNPEVVGYVSRILDNLPKASIYDIHGYRIENLKKGLIIMHTNNGKTKKVVCK